MKLGIVAAVILPWALAAGTASGQTSIPDSLTVDEAVHMALASHPAVAKARQEAAAAEARIGASRAPYYPDISFSGMYDRVGPVIEFDIPNTGVFKLNPENNYDFHLGLRQALYDFGRTSASVELARSQSQTAGSYVGKVESDIAYRTISIFNYILILRQSVSVLDEQIQALNQHLDISRKKVQAGTATDFDVLTTQVRIATAEDERIDAADMLKTQEILFRQLTGLPADRPVALKGEFTSVHPSLDPDALVDEALRQRPEMELSKGAETSAALQLNLSGLGDRPSLGLSLTSGFKTGYVPNLDTWKPNFTAGVRLQFPIFNGHRTRFRENEARANLDSAKSATEDLKRRIVAEVSQAISNAGAALQKIQNAEILVRQAQEAVRLAEAKYVAGVVTNLDLLDAQTTLTQAKLNHLRALYNYTVSLTALDRATGRKAW
jgi:outer membrane protein